MKCHCLFNDAKSKEIYSYKDSNKDYKTNYSDGYFRVTSDGSIQFAITEEKAQFILEKKLEEKQNKYKKIISVSNDKIDKYIDNKVDLDKKLKDDGDIYYYKVVNKGLFKKKEVIDAINNDEMYVCRCEEITKAEVTEAVRAGATSVNEVKRLLRTGMGLCQGRNCAKTIERIIATELGVAPSQVPQATKRGPVRPIKLTGYTSLDIEAQEEMFEHDW